MEKTLTNSDASGARANVADLKIVGNGDLWQLLCKASSQRVGDVTRYVKAHAK